MQPQFTSSFSFLMAATGFAVGLGNIWRFPYMTGENGGGAFVLAYLLCVGIIGIPIVIAEILAGRSGGAHPPLAIGRLAQAGGHSKQWRHLGHLNLLTAFLLVGTYCVVAGWVIWYLYKAASTGFAGVTAMEAVAGFEQVQASIGGMLAWTLVGLLLVGGIIYSGVNRGIEPSVRVLMPALILLVIALVAYNAFQPGFGQAVSYLFTPDFSKLSGETFLAAVGQAFFSIGVAMAGMMMFGAYLPPHVSIARCALAIIAIDTLVALLAGVMIFPMVFRFGLDPESGAGLIFETLPVVFAQMPGGQLVAVVFFLLLMVAAITSMVGFMEPVVAWLEEKYHQSRHLATLCTLAAVILVGAASVMSYTTIAELTVGPFNLNGFLDYLSGQIMLPVGGLFIAIFVGWRVSNERARKELPQMSDRAFAAWRFLIRYPVPLAIAVILVTGLG